MKRLLIILLVPLVFTSCGIYSKSSFNPVYKNIGPFLHYYDGIQSRLYGDLGNAIINFKSALELEPANDAIFYELGICYNMLNLPDSAAKYLGQAVQLNGTNKHYRNLYGIILINTNRFDEALQNQKELVAIDSLSVNYRFQLALLFSQLKQFDNALFELNKLERSVGYNTRVAEIKLRIFLENNDTDNALKEVNSIIQIEPDNPVYHIYRSDIYFSKGLDSLAFSTLKYAASLDSLTPQANIQLYQRYMQMGNYTNALNTLSVLFKNPQLDVEEKVQLFYPLLFEQKLYTSFMPQLDSLTSSLNIQYPDNILVYELLYEHYIRTQNIPKARETLQILTLIDESNAKRWEKLIAFDYSLKNFKTVLVNSAKASELFPTYSIFYILHALVLDEIDQTDKAIQLLKNNVDKVTNKEEKAELLGTLADYYYKQRQLRNAFSLYEKALKQHPKNTRILNNYSYYLALENIQLNKALEMSTQAVDLDPNNATFIDTKGWVLFKLQRYEEARDVLRNAIAKSSNPSADINEHYGDALFMTGNKQNAYIYWKKAQQLSGGSPKLNEKISTQQYVP
ncbi:MAG: tetratricopeptide repeat protein [Bacteroidales bacterium]